MSHPQTNTLSFRPVSQSTPVNITQDYAAISLTGPGYPIDNSEFLFVIHAAFHNRGQPGRDAALSFVRKLRSLDRAQSNSVIYCCEPLVLTRNVANLQNSEYQQRQAHKMLCDLVNARLAQQYKLDEIALAVRSTKEILTTEQLKERMDAVELRHLSKVDGVTHKAQPLEQQPEQHPAQHQLQPSQDQQSQLQQQAQPQPQLQHEDNDTKQPAQAKAAESTCDELFVTPALWKNPKQNYAVVQCVGYLGNDQFPEPLLIVYGVVNTEKEFDQLCQVIHTNAPQERPKLYRPLNVPTNEDTAVDDNLRNYAYRWALHDPFYPYLLVPIDEPKSPYFEKFKSIQQIRVFDSTVADGGETAKLLTESDAQVNEAIRKHQQEELVKLANRTSS